MIAYYSKGTCCVEVPDGATLGTVAYPLRGSGRQAAYWNPIHRACFYLPDCICGSIGAGKPRFFTRSKWVPAAKLADGRVIALLSESDGPAVHQYSEDVTLNWGWTFEPRTDGFVTQTQGEMFGVGARSPMRLGVAI